MHLAKSYTTLIFYQLPKTTIHSMCNHVPCFPAIFMQICRSWYPRMDEYSQDTHAEYFIYFLWNKTIKCAMLLGLNKPASLSILHFQSIAYERSAYDFQERNGMGRVCLEYLSMQFAWILITHRKCPQHICVLWIVTVPAIWNSEGIHLQMWYPDGNHWEFGMFSIGLMWSRKITTLGLSHQRKNIGLKKTGPMANCTSATANCRSIDVQAHIP